jgi:hypothetical protein
MRQGRRFIQAWGNAPEKDSIKLISVIIRPWKESLLPDAERREMT